MNRGAAASRRYVVSLPACDETHVTHGRSSFEGQSSRVPALERHIFCWPARHPFSRRASGGPPVHHVHGLGIAATDVPPCVHCGVNACRQPGQPVDSVKFQLASQRVLVGRRGTVTPAADCTAATLQRTIADNVSALSSQSVCPTGNWSTCNLMLRWHAPTHA